MCHPQGACFVTLPNYLSTVASLVKINKIFKTLKFSNVIKYLLLHEVCMVAVYSLRVGVAVVPARYVIQQGNRAKLPEDDTSGVETRRSLIIYIYDNCAFVG